jgi:hypothetical protein
MGAIRLGTCTLWFISPMHSLPYTYYLAMRRPRPYDLPCVQIRK